MTREQAQREAKRRWGAKAKLTAGERQTSPERRQAAKDRRDAIDAEREAIKADIARRLAELPWYAEAQARLHALYVERRPLEFEPHHYRFRVGTSNGLFNTILGEGDTWEEAFAAADRKATL